jgi:hypothetical protein
MEWRVACVEATWFFITRFVFAQLYTAVGNFTWDFTGLGCCCVIYFWWRAFWGEAVIVS